MVIRASGGLGCSSGAAESKSSTLDLKVEAIPELWPNWVSWVEILVVTHDPVGRSAVSINLAPQGPARRLGRDYLSGDACLGPPRAINIPNGLTAETSAQLPWLGKLFHRWMVEF